MQSLAVYKTESYEDEVLYNAIKKHFDAHNIAREIPEGAKVLLKPNLVTDKEAAFSVTTNPRFVFAVIRCLREIGVKDITIADCPGGALLLFSQMQDVYKKTGYSFLSEYAVLNTDFESSDVLTASGFTNKKFNIINAVNGADYIINLPKLKTHNMTCITAAVKNLFGVIPGLQKPAFHAKYPAAKDFSNMLVELAATVKPDFTIVDAIDIMEGNGPTNGRKRYLGLTFSGKDIFTLDKFIVNTIGVAEDKVPTIAASARKGFIDNELIAKGDTDFVVFSPIVLPDVKNADTSGKKITARVGSLVQKMSDAVFMKYPQMNDKCILCKKCIVTCPKKALRIADKTVQLDKKKCIGCLCCDEVCVNGAVDIKKKIKMR
ncbi:MAG: DUF362 domain-containing protein [Acutalibacteraceae bacterium]|nr:DUF362 domain-containing protein [Acutalibacteraceae bacterium]